MGIEKPIDVETYTGSFLQAEKNDPSKQQPITDTVQESGEKKPIQEIRTKVSFNSEYYRTGNREIATAFCQNTTSERTSYQHVSSIDPALASFLKDEKLLNDFCLRLQKKIAEKYPKKQFNSGAFASWGILHTTKLTTEFTHCTVGNCTVNRFNPVNKSGKKISRLNEWHSPRNINERKRIDQADPENGYEIAKGLPFSRAFGVEKYKYKTKETDDPSKQIISCLPDIQTHSFNPKGDDGFLIITNEKLTRPFGNEKSKDIEGYFSTEIKNYAEHPDHKELPTIIKTTGALVMGAYFKATKGNYESDHINAIIIPLQPTKNYQPSSGTNQLIITAVFQGYGSDGGTIAKFLADNYLSVLSELLSEKKLFEQAQSRAKFFESAKNLKNTVLGCIWFNKKIAPKETQNTQQIELKQENIPSQSQ